MPTLRASTATTWAAAGGETPKGRMFLAGCGVARPRICFGMSFVLVPKIRPNPCRQNGSEFLERALASLGYAFFKKGRRLRNQFIYDLGGRLLLIYHPHALTGHNRATLDVTVDHGPA